MKVLNIFYLQNILGAYFPNPQDLGNFMGQVQIYTGLTTIVVMFIGSYILRKCSWKVAALVTPLIILVTGALFFLFIIFGTYFESHFGLITVSTALLAVLFGAFQNIFSKATKYSLFDATKEISYIPLDEELKSKGKAAADVIGGRLGKSGGAIIQWGLLSLIPGATLISLAPELFTIFLLAAFWWILSARNLSIEFEKKHKVIKN